MPLCKWDVSAAIHIHVILAGINREDERFLLGARSRPPVRSLDLRAWGLFFSVAGRVGREVKTYGLITLARCQAIFLSCRPALGNRSSLCLPFALIYTMKTNAVFQCAHSSARNWNTFHGTCLFHPFFPRLFIASFINYDLEAAHPLNDTKRDFYDTQLSNAWLYIVALKKIKFSRILNKFVNIFIYVPNVMIRNLILMIDSIKDLFALKK